MQSFCTFLLIFKQLWFWSFFLLLLPRGSSCFWLNFWLHQGKSVNAGQPAPSVTPPGAPIQAPLMYRGSVRLWCHPQHIHTHYLVAVNLWLVSPTPRPKKKNDTWPSSCTPLWFMILLCLEENQRHVKEGNLGSLLCTTWDAVAWGPLGEASSCLSSPSPPVGVFPLSPRCSAQRCRAQWQACPKNSPRGWRGKSANRGGVACTAFSSKKVTPN